LNIWQLSYARLSHCDPLTSRVCGRSYLHLSYLTPLALLFLLALYGDHRGLHSFPTRRSSDLVGPDAMPETVAFLLRRGRADQHPDRKSTRLNSSHVAISYAVFCVKKKNIPYFAPVNSSAIGVATRHGEPAEDNREEPATDVMS